MSEDIKSKLDTFVTNMTKKIENKQLIPEILLEYDELIEFLDKFTILKNEEFEALEKVMSKYELSVKRYEEEVKSYTMQKKLDDEKIKNLKDEINKIINSIGIKESENYNNINSKNNNLNINENLINKLIPLTKNTICYYREIKNISNKFNPIEDNISIGNLTENPYNFIKCIILLNKTYNGINFISSNFNYNYNLNQIDNTIMNSNLKIIIEIHRDYRKYKSTNKNNNSNSINDFIKKEKLKYFNYDNNFIEKCALNEYYNFSLLINKNKRIEIVLCSYEDFKLWINGFAFIIKNKKLLMNTK